MSSTPQLLSFSLLNSSLHRLLIITLVLTSSCRKCLDCNRAKFSEAEKILVFDGRDHVQYSNGVDAVSITVAHTLSDAPYESCGSFPATPSCISLGSATLYYEQADTHPIHNVLMVSTTKDNTTWQCTNFEIGNTFYLNLDKNYKLTERFDNNYQINVVRNFTLNKVNYGDAQEVIKPVALGNVSELMRVLYVPALGVVELTYTNPPETWRQLY